MGKGRVEKRDQGDLKVGNNGAALCGETALREQAKYFIKENHCICMSV